MQRFMIALTVGAALLGGPAITHAAWDDRVVQHMSLLAQHAPALRGRHLGGD
jgi:hypothetical protein